MFPQLWLSFPNVFYMPILLYFVFFQNFVAKKMAMGKKLGSWGKNGNGAGVVVAPIPSLLSRVLGLLITNQPTKPTEKSRNRARIGK